MKAIAVIPARFQSTRLPGKALKDIGGKPMIQHVFERVKQADLVHDAVIATDDERILRAAENFGGKAVMTSAHHQSGTDRLIEISTKIEADLYINVQGDEPFISPDDINKLIQNLSLKESEDIVTLCYPALFKEAKPQNKVKVVFSSDKKALYFSRALIPFSNKLDTQNYHIHIGMYGYGSGALERIKELPPSTLELAESLEQLRFLQAGLNIYVDITNEPGLSVDTEDCLEKARYFYETGKLREIKPELSNIKLLVMDVDGVLSPASLMLSENGEEIKVFDVRDGMGIKRLLKAGIKLAVISGRGSSTTANRLKQLGITEYFFNVEQKGVVLKELIDRYALKKEEVLYIGDDINDLPAFNLAGISCTVADAPDYIKEKADIVLSKKGGKGAIREMSDKILSKIS
ncbi:MAG: 3-deoxy-manno-octulosonate cytidylyltransferase [Balneolaceae bacterium]|nr:MAG: 3-deoxy-manno-octulosonate cytidylyltransferase [Balneolaceae bacterium]